MSIRTDLQSLPFRSLGDLLLRYFAFWIFFQCHMVMITLGGLHGVIPYFYPSMGTYHIDLLIPLVFVEVPLWWLCVSVISIWRKSWWIEIGCAFVIVALLWWIVPYLARDLTVAIRDWDIVFQYKENRILQHYVTSTATMIIMVASAFLIALLKSWRGVYNSDC